MDLVNELKALTSDELAKILGTFSYRDREIIKLRLGVGDGYVYTREEVAHIFKMNREDLEKTEQRAFEKLARRLPVQVRHVSPLELLLDPGTATKEEVADLLFEISALYRLIGGNGIQFSVVDAREPIMAEGEA